VRLWLVGKNIAELGVLVAWEFQGIFDTEENAAAVCSTTRHFIAPVTLNEPVPEDTSEFPNCRYPLGGVA
jgi:hypothetical protein